MHRLSQGIHKENLPGVAPHPANREEKVQVPAVRKRFQAQSTYQNHLRYHKGKKEFICTYCGKAFMQKAHLRRHTATHTGERNHICPDCQKLFVEPGDVRKHMRTHSKNAINFHTGGLPSLGGQGGGEDGEAGGAKPLILHEGHENDESFQKAQRKVDTSEKGPDSWGHGRKRSRRSPSRRLGLPDRRG